MILEWWSEIDLTISVWTSLGHPLGEVADEVEEELVLRDAEDLVHHLHKEAEALTHKKVSENGRLWKWQKMGGFENGRLSNLARHQVELINKGFAEVLRSRWGLHQDRLDITFTTTKFFLPRHHKLKKWNKLASIFENIGLSCLFVCLCCQEQNFSCNTYNWNTEIPPQCRPGNKLCARFPSFCAGFPQLPPARGIPCESDISWNSNICISWSVNSSKFKCLSFSIGLTIMKTVIFNCFGIYHYSIVY